MLGIICIFIEIMIKCNYKKRRSNATESYFCHVRYSFFEQIPVRQINCQRKIYMTVKKQPCFFLLKLLGNNPRLARHVIISFVIFNKNTLNLFNLDIGSVLNYFLVFFC